MAVEVGAPVDFVIRITGTISSSCIVPPEASMQVGPLMSWNILLLNKWENVTFAGMNAPM